MKSKTTLFLILFSVWNTYADRSLRTTGVVAPHWSPNSLTFIVSDGPNVILTVGMKNISDIPQKISMSGGFANHNNPTLNYPLRAICKKLCTISSGVVTLDPTGYVSYTTTDPTKNPTDPYFNQIPVVWDFTVSVEANANSDTGALVGWGAATGFYQDPGRFFQLNEGKPF